MRFDDVMLLLGSGVNILAAVTVPYFWASSISLFAAGMLFGIAMVSMAIYRSERSRR